MLAFGLPDENVVLTILHNVLKVNLRDRTRTHLADQLRFLMARLYDALVRVDDFLLLLRCNDRLLEL
jgi:hypothetical protein